MLQITSVTVNGAKGGCVTDERAPRIAFSLSSDRQGEALSSAVITVGDWKRITYDQLNNRYDGPLAPFTEYGVRVKAVGTSGDMAEAETSFRTGRLDTPWRAKWITDADYRTPNKQSPLPMAFQRSFRAEKSPRRAWLECTALGVYELTLNGEKVGKDYFAPGFTSYAHHIQYQTYEVTDMLLRENTLIAVVAGGWAVGSFTYGRKNRISADRQAFLLELHIEYTDGSVALITTDENWRVTEEGPYRMAEWYDGETYDARIMYSSVPWKPASITSPRGTPRLIAGYGAPVRAQEKFIPVSWTVAPSGELVYDFGQNFAGVICAKIRGKAGQTVVFRHAEVLLNGELFVKSLRTAKATATYFCKDGEQTYSPRLTYMGFRYVGITGIAAEDLELTALAVYSDIGETGAFSCSDATLNRLNENIRWSGKSNFVDIPTDCPQRDERQGWTGDIAVFARTACFNFDMGRFFDKWLSDMRAEQGKGGGIPMVVPRGGDNWPVMATSCWGDSCVLVPWAEYLARGDKSLLEKQYPTIRRFLKAAGWWSRFFALTPSGRYIWRFPFHFGDWCAPEGTAREWIMRGKWIGTAYYFNSCRIAADMAEILGRSGDAAAYRDLAKKIAAAYRKVFTDGRGRLKKEFQTAYALPLHFGMTSGEETARMAENLARLIRENGGHLATGFPGTPYILFALSDYGQTEAAYQLLLQRGCPSWLYEVLSGGTTIWERWDALRPDGTVNIGDLTGRKDDDASRGGMVSFNHYAGGAVGDFLYRRVAGLEPLEGGYRRFAVRPLPGGGITHARGEVQTPYGRAASAWRIEDGVFTIRVQVPVGTNCFLTLPGGRQHALSAGRHEFSEKV
ncbi:MAG: family 78 glycoside hydrolase catalytic domain [Christensenellales bacterium]|jgi:alpha-L-rhamnosidase